MSREKVEAFRQWLSRVSYKPGWRLDVIDHIDVNIPPLLSILFRTTDAYDPKKTVEVCKTAPLSEYVLNRPEYWPSWLHKQLFFMEAHELGEWLVIDGERPYDPHKEKV